jgi:hypothetical protein
MSHRVTYDANNICEDFVRIFHPVIYTFRVMMRIFDRIQSEFYSRKKLSNKFLLLLQYFFSRESNCVCCLAGMALMFIWVENLDLNVCASMYYINRIEATRRRNKFLLLLQAFSRGSNGCCL